MGERKVLIRGGRNPGGGRTFSSSIFFLEKGPGGYLLQKNSFYGGVKICAPFESFLARFKPPTRFPSFFGENGVHLFYSPVPRWAHRVRFPPRGERGGKHFLGPPHWGLKGGQNLSRGPRVESPPRGALLRAPRGGYKRHHRGRNASSQ